MLATGGKRYYVNARLMDSRSASVRLRMSILLNILAIVTCGAAGAGAGYGVLALLDLHGLTGAFVAAGVGMVVASAAWAAGSTALRAAGWIR